MRRSQALMESQGVTTQMFRLVDHPVASGVYPDMREHGWQEDAWPELWPKVEAADILIVGTPIWLGENSSQTRVLIERLYAMSALQNTKGQYVYYGKVAGMLITGNEDGVKHSAMSTLYSLQHIGYSISPAADAGWVGEAGPGPSYLDAGSGGPENDFTNRNTTFATWNLMHLAALLKSNGGFPAEGNSQAVWDSGNHTGFASHPEDH